MRAAIDMKEGEVVKLVAHLARGIRRYGGASP